MSFETYDRDLLGRIGRLRTKRGVIETPLLLPVVNPLKQSISPKEMYTTFHCPALIVNAYLLKKNFEEEVRTIGVHDFLEFDGTVMTDSGAYQILVYGQVDTSAEEIAQFEEDIDTDIAVILDVPTGWNAPRHKAEYTVEETLRRSRLTLDSLRRDDILWVGPVQGGTHLDLVAYSAMEIAKMPFHINALGSPTQVMERYLFDLLVDMVMTAKTRLPPEKPLHLFGAGHPFMLSLAVAMGCDMFDSAAYALSARQGKYLTVQGTAKLQDLMYFPCECQVCAQHTPHELRALPEGKRTRLLTWHNLAACFTELRTIKQAIKDGRLWELLELRTRSHPHLLRALKVLGKYQDSLEAHTPVSKAKGFFFFDSMGLVRPEILRHRKKLEKWWPSTQGSILVMLPQPSSKPFHRSREYKRVRRLASARMGARITEVDFCFYVVPFGVTPIELDEIYPLSQFEVSHPLNSAAVDYVIDQIEVYVATNRKKYQSLVLHFNPVFGEKLVAVCRQVCARTGLSLFISARNEQMWSTPGIEELISTMAQLVTSGPH